MKRRRNGGLAASAVAGTATSWSPGLPRPCASGSAACPTSTSSSIRGRAPASTADRVHFALMSTDTCPKCGSSERIRDARVMDRGEQNYKRDLEVQVLRSPYTENLQALLEAYRASQ